MTTADALSWRTSTRSSNGESCVEVAPVADGVLLRHSKHPDAGTISFPSASWAVFLGEVLDGPTGANGVVTIAPAGDDTLLTAHRTAVLLRFDPDEWAAFKAGAAAGEFAPSGLLATGAVAGGHR